MSPEGIALAMERAWLDLMEADRRHPPRWMYINGELYTALDALEREPQVCSPAGLACLFPALRRKA